MTDPNQLKDYLVALKQFAAQDQVQLTEADLGQFETPAFRALEHIAACILNEAYSAVASRETSIEDVRYAQGRISGAGFILGAKALLQAYLDVESTPEEKDKFNTFAAALEEIVGRTPKGE